MLLSRIIQRNTPQVSSSIFLRAPAQYRSFSATIPAMTLISQTVKNDHRELEDAYRKILSAGTADEKIQWQNQFTWELARHSVGEELLVYPAFEKNVSDGKQLADKDRAEHQKIKELLYKFQSLQPNNPEFIPTLQSIWSNLSQHIKEEEEEDLVKLENALQQSESESLATQFHRTKKFIPTRSHPSAPDKPPFETVAGLLAAPLDHLSDIFRKFPAESKSQLPP